MERLLRAPIQRPSQERSQRFSRVSQCNNGESSGLVHDAGRLVGGRFFFDGVKNNVEYAHLTSNGLLRSEFDTQFAAS